MELINPTQIMDFHFYEESQSSSLQPSSPRPFGDYYHSAPNSPARISAFYRHNSETSPDPAPAAHHYYKDEFAFDFSPEIEATSLSADQLFDGGRIRPLKPPPLPPKENKLTEQERGRGRGRERERVSPSLTSSNSRRRSTRSLSPFRVSDYPWEQLEKADDENQQLNTKQSSTSKPPSSKGHRKWRLKDLCLFRSASEGRADPIKKYSSLFRRHEGKQASSGTPAVSAHELHYKTNRAVSEDLKKKTFLPYNQGIFGRLAFNPALHPLSNGFGFSHQ